MKLQHETYLIHPPHQQPHSSKHITLKYAKAIRRQRIHAPAPDQLQTLKKTKEL